MPPKVLKKDKYIWDAYKSRCVVHPRKYAVCLHEEPPKSMNPYWEQFPTQRFPLCNECHEKVHSIGRRDAEYLLYESRAKNFPLAVCQIDDYNMAHE